jgi:hypothetical protein
MKRKLGLLGVVVGAVALALVGVLQDVSTTKALIPLPVRPIALNTTVEGGQSTNQLGQVQDSYAAAIGHRGTRSAASAGWSRGGAGYPDIAIDDGVPLGDFTSLTDLFCDSATLDDGDLIADTDGGTPAHPIPFTFNEGNTDLVAAGLDYLAARAGVFPMADRFGTNINGVWLFGTVNVPLTGSSMIPVNIFTLHIPWAPNSGVSQIWVGGAAAKPGTMCADSGQNNIAAPKGALSHTMGSWTTPVALTNTPPIKGDSGSPCSGGNCADKQVYGFWPDKSIVDASGGAQVVTVTQRALDAGPDSGNFKDVWHVSAPAGVTATWGASMTERRWNGTSWAAEAAPTITGSGAEISFVEDSLIVGDTYEDVGTLTISCTSTGDYILALLTTSNPVSPTKDNDLVSNAYMSTIRVKCPGAGTEVDKQVISVTAQITALDAGSVGFNPAITATTPPADNLQLLVGDSATVNVRELLRNVGTADAAALNVLGAEAPDMDGNGTYDITVNWVDGSTTAVYGSDPDSLTTMSITDTCSAWGGMSCANLNVSMTEPHGPMIAVRADLEIECSTAGKFLVPLKGVDIPTTVGDSAPVNNVAWTSLSVSCWANSGARSAAIDGIDDDTGLYSSFNSATSEADLRKAVSPTSKPATGIASDTGYVERWVTPDCMWYDGDDDAPDTNGDGWISGPESMSDPDIPAGVDDDGDCLADAALAQPGKAADYNDVAGTAMCPAIVYDEGNAPYAQVQNLQSADEDCDGLIDGNEYVFGSNPRMADSDGDGLSDFYEVFQLTNPLNPDTDGDGLLDKPEDDYVNAAAGSAESGESVNADDNCPAVYNPTQTNTDGVRRDNGTVVPGSWASNPNQDKLGDACDEDDDNDRALDAAETTVLPYTNPLVADSDGDGCVDGWESITGKDPNSAASKCPAALTPALQTLARGCHLNLPGTLFGGPFAPGYGGTEYVEMDVDGDGLACQSGSTITDTDSDDGTGSGTTPPVQIVDSVEAMGYNLMVSNKDTDGDGCEDWIEIVDVNGNRSAELLDVLFVAKRALGVDPAPGSDKVLDIDKNGAVTILDALVAAKNSSLVKSHSPCASEG